MPRPRPPAPGWRPWTLVVALAVSLAAWLLLVGCAQAPLRAGVAAAAAAAPNGTAAEDAESAEQAVVLLVGDSTLAPQTGYGDALCTLLQPAVACLNLGRGGRSTHSYRAEGLWQRVLARLQAADARLPRHVLIQFGHNDQPGKPGRSTRLADEFPANLTRYLAEVRATGAVPVLLTPLTRRQFAGDTLKDDLAPWADAVRRVAQAEAVPLVDLHHLSQQAVQALGPAQADTLAQAAPGAPGFDRTHLGERGACVFAALVAQALRQQVTALAAAVQPGPDCNRLPLPGNGPAPGHALHAASFVHSGWAVGTVGGRGGRILRVTTLADSGPGSLREALQTPGPRLIVFEVGGVIDLQGGKLSIRHPFVTIAGQTAPAPGITLVRGELGIATHDVVVQHLAFRPGAYGRAPRSGPDHDGLGTLGGAHHVIVDHCSFSWATDENLSISGPRFGQGDRGTDPDTWRRATSHHITFSHNLVFEGLSHSVHPKGEHSKGTLVHDNSSGVLLMGNLWAGNRERNPLLKGGVQAALVNNLIVAPGRRAVHYNLHAAEWAGRPFQPGRLALWGNVLRHGAATAPDTALFALGGDGDLVLHAADNLAYRADSQAAPQTGRYGPGAARLLPADEPAAAATQAAPPLPPRLQPLPAAALEARLPSLVGARPWDRHAIDTRVLADIAAGRVRVIDDEAEVGGLPTTGAPTRRRFELSRWQREDLSPRAGWASLFPPPAQAVALPKTSSP